MRIRKAVRADEKKICDLFEEMLKTIYHTREVNGYEAGYLEKYWADAEDLIYVAEDDEVRAFLSIEVHRESEAYLYLDDFSVTETYRNRGIGTSLLRAAEAYAKELGIAVIVLHVEKANEAALRLYKRLDYSVYRDDGSRYLMSREMA